MARYEIKNPLTPEGRNQLNAMFEELYREYTEAGDNARDAREKAIQAVADSLLAKDIAETTRQEMIDIIREQTQNGDLAPEIAQARGGHQVLGERLNSVDEQLAQTEKVVNLDNYSHLKVADGNGYDWTSAFEAAISDLKDGDKFVVPYNEYIVTKRLTFNQSNIVIDFNNSNIVWKGIGLDSLYTGVFQFMGELTEQSTSVILDEDEKTKTITVSDSSVFNVGDYVLIRPTDGVTSDYKDMNNRYFAQIVKITENTLHLNYRKRLGATASLGVTVTKVNPVKNIVIRNLNIIAQNQTSRQNGIGGIFTNYCDNLIAENISFKGLWFKGFKTTYSTNVTINNITVSEPASTNGGEGYGVQFEYSHLCNVKHGRFNNVRHGTDCTASSHIFFEDCVTNDGTNTSYVLHKAFEWLITYKDCYSINDAQGGWANSSMNSGFGDTSDDIKLENCHAINAESYGFSAVGKGKNYTLINCSFSVRLGSSGNAVHVVENNTRMINCELHGALMVNKIEGATNDGVVQLDKTELNVQQSNRAIITLPNTKVYFENSIVNGRSDLSNGTNIIANNSAFNTQEEAVLFHYTGDGSNISFAFDNCIINTSGSGANTSYEWKGEKVIFNNCQFINPHNRVHMIKTKVAEYTNNCRGTVRVLIDQMNGINVVISNNNFNDLLDIALFTITNSSGDILVDTNIIKQSSNSRIALNFPDSNNALRVIKKGNFIIGGVRMVGAVRSVIKDNMINGATIELPENNEINHYVKDNVINR